MPINIIVEAPDLEAAGDRGIKKLRRALTFAINESAKAGRDEFISYHRSASTVRKKSILPRIKVGDKARVGDRLRANLWVGGKPYRSSEYVSQDVYPNGTLVWIRSSSPTRFPSAFIKKSEQGRKRAPVWQRKRNTRFPIFDPVAATGIGAADIVRPHKNKAIAHIIKVFGSRFGAERAKLGI